MRKIILSAKNIKHIESLLKRFFFNKKNGYEMYHNFDCGFKNIKPFGSVTMDRSVDCLGVKTDRLNGKPYIHISFQDGVSGTHFGLGTVFIFKGGNEIIVKDEWIGTTSKYIYVVFRLKKLMDDDVFMILERRDFEKGISDDYWNSLDNEY